MDQDIFEGKELYCHPNMIDFFNEVFNTESLDQIHRPFLVEIKIDENLPEYRYKIVNDRFRNDRFTTWFEDLNFPPEWAIGLGIVQKIPCYYKFDPREMRVI